MTGGTMARVGPGGGALRPRGGWAGAPYPPAGRTGWMGYGGGAADRGCGGGADATTGGTGTNEAAGGTGAAKTGATGAAGFVGALAVRTGILRAGILCLRALRA